MNENLILTTVYNNIHLNIIVMIFA